MKVERNVRRGAFHKEGIGLLVGMVVLFGATLLYLYFAYNTRVAFWITLPFLVVLSALAFNFFRYPERTFTGEHEGRVVAASDGTIVVVERVYEPEVLKCECWQVSTFMSVFNVHAQWVPLDGRVAYVKHELGRYMAAHLPKSSVENERSSILFKTPEGHHVLMRQVAGAVARRVVTYLEEGEECQLNDPLGFIKFGSRIDYYLPLDSKILVKPSDKVTGNQTVLAELPVA